MQRREELFERERHQEPVAGWHSCDLACAERYLINGRLVKSNVRRWAAFTV